MLDVTALDDFFGMRAGQRREIEQTAGDFRVGRLVAGGIPS
jgi:hypothetical protein